MKFAVFDDDMTAARAASTFPVFSPPHGSGVLCVAWGSYTLAANPSVSDVIRFFKLPAGATLISGLLMGADIDTGTETFDMDVGWEANADEAADPDGFGNFGVVSGDTIAELIPVAGIWRPFQGVLLTAGPKRFNSETMISGTVNAAAAAGGTGVITAIGYYTVP